MSDPDGYELAREVADTFVSLLVVLMLGGACLSCCVGGGARDHRHGIDACQTACGEAGMRSYAASGECVCREAAR